MSTFNEHSLEMAIMELFQDENYEYISGDMIQRKQTEVLLENTEINNYKIFTKQKKSDIIEEWKEHLSQNILKKLKKKKSMTDIVTK